MATHRALTSDQLSVLFWGQEKANTRCRERLRLLSEHGFLERAEQPVTLAEGRRPRVYFLDRSGLEVAAATLAVEPSAIDWKKSYNTVKWLFLDHLLATNDIRVRLEHAAPQLGLTLTDWRDDKTLSTYKDEVTVTGPEGRGHRVTIGPDGYVALTDRDGSTQHRAFVEADRATESLTRWREKVTGYLAYFRTPAFRDRYHARKPFRVLAVTTTPERMKNMKAVTEEVGGRSWFWFTTYAAIAQPGAVLFTPVWYMAGAEDAVCFPYPLTPDPASNTTS